MAGKRNPQGHGSVYKEEKPNRSTRWVAERWVVLPDGRKKRVRARGVTQADAIAELDVKARRFERLNPTADRLTVSDYMTTWLAHKEAHVRTSTLRAYKQDVRLHIRPVLGKKRLGRLQAHECQAVIDHLANTKRKSMADRVRRTLKQALRQAVKWGYLNANPMDRVDPVRRDEPKRSVYTLKQLRAFLDAAKATRYYPIFLLAIATGMRKGEVLALKWSDLEPEGVHVRRTVSHKASGDGTAGPKTRAGVRFIPVERETMRVILESRTPHARDDDWVFTTRNGKRHSVRTISRVMRKLQQDMGLPEIRFHDFRRSYATLLAERGHHPRVIQAMLGHSTPTLAMTVYTDVTDNSRNRVHIGLHGGGRNGGNSTGRERTRDEGKEADGPVGERSLEA